MAAGGDHLHDIVGVGIETAEVVEIDDVNIAFFAADDSFGNAGDAGRKHHHAGRAEIGIGCVIAELILRREKVGGLERGVVGGGNSDDAVAEIVAAGVGIEVAVAGGEVKISISVGGESRKDRKSTRLN